MEHGSTSTITNMVMTPSFELISDKFNLFFLSGIFRCALFHSASST